MSIYSYVLRYDDGVAPNPFHDVCTLAICKPKIRKYASKNDWVIGTGSRDNVNKYDNIPRIIYAMKIEDKKSLTDYFDDPKFLNKRPKWNSPKPSDWTGDNIYEMKNGKVIQHPSVHSNGNNEDEESKLHDLSGENVLISRNFWYWGKNALILPDDFSQFPKKGQSHKIITNENLIKKFEEWVHIQPKPNKFIPFQPLAEMDEDGNYIYNEKTKSYKCFRVDCKWEDDEEIIQ